jgi:MFS family permease
MGSQQPSRADATVQEFVDRNLSWNFSVNVLVSALYQLSMSFIYGSTVLSLYTSYLTESAVLIGLVPAIQNAMFFVPQLLMARHAQSLGTLKPWLVRYNLIERVPYGFVALVILLWPGAPGGLAYAVLLLSLMVAMAGGGVSNPAWKKMIAKVVPVRRRGLMFGISNALGGLMGVGGAALSRVVFARWEYPTTFGISFLLCFVVQMISWCVMNLNREPTVEPASQPQGAREYWRRLPGLIRQDRNFARFLIARTISIFGTMGMAFYVVYARQVFGISDTFAAGLTMSALIAQTVSTPVLGQIGDRLGHKALMELSGLFLIGALLAAVFATSTAWLYAIFALANISMASGMIAGMAITMEFGPPEEMPTYSALASTVQALPVLLAPLVGGWLIDLTGYQPMFILAALLSLGGVSYMHWFVRDPRHDGADHGRAPHARP